MRKVRPAMSHNFEPDGTLAGDVIVHRGILQISGSITRYFTSQPAVTQWVAVGLESPIEDQGDLRVIVGSGRTEDDAIFDLRSRLARGRPHGERSTPAPVQLDHNRGLDSQQLEG